MDVQLHPMSVPPLPASTRIVRKREFSCVLEEEELNGGKRKADEMEFGKCVSEDGVSGESKRKQIDWPKGTRSAEIHNMSERRRRDRIKGKMTALQHLIPNCNKSDRASMLDDAIDYLKTLQFQVQMMSMGGGGALCQAPYMSPSGIQSIQVPQFSAYVPMRPGLGMGLGYGMGMMNMNYPRNFPMIQVPSTNLHPPLSAAAAAAHLPLMSGSGVVPFSHVQMPFVPQQTLVETAATSTSNALPTFATEFSTHFNTSNQEQSSSQYIPRF